MAVISLSRFPALVIDRPFIFRSGIAACPEDERVVFDTIADAAAALSNIAVSATRPIGVVIGSAPEVPDELNIKAMIEDALFLNRANKFCLHIFLETKITIIIPLPLLQNWASPGLGYEPYTQAIWFNRLLKDAAAKHDLFILDSDRALSRAGIDRHAQPNDPCFLLKEYRTIIRDIVSEE